MVPGKHWPITPPLWSPTIADLPLHRHTHADAPRLVKDHRRSVASETPRYAHLQLAAASADVHIAKLIAIGRGNLIKVNEADGKLVVDGYELTTWTGTAGGRSQGVRIARQEVSAPKPPLVARLRALTWKTPVACFQLPNRSLTPGVSGKKRDMPTRKAADTRGSGGGHFRNGRNITIGAVAIRLQSL